MLIAAIGMTYFDADWSPGIHAKLGVSLFGGLIAFVGIYFWALEGNEGYHLHLDKDGKPIDAAEHPKH
jgi:cytochrome c oxidase subunit 1